MIQTERHRETGIMMDVEGHKQRKLQREKEVDRHSDGEREGDRKPEMTNQSEIAR